MTQAPALLFSSSSSGREAIVWACVARDETKLVEVQAGEGNLSDVVLSTAKCLLAKEITIGWDSCSSSVSTTVTTITSTSNSSCSTSLPAYKGLRFPVYEMRDDDPSRGPPRVWTFACVYNPATITKRRAQAFLEKIVMISEFFRESDGGWRKGGEHCCNDEFGPIIQQRMQEMKDSSAVADENLDLSAQIIKLNRAVLNALRLHDSNKTSQDHRDEQQTLLSTDESRAPDIITTSSTGSSHNSNHNNNNNSKEKFPPASELAFESSQPQPQERVFHSNLRFVAKSKQQAASLEEFASQKQNQERDRLDSVEDILQSLEKEACRQPTKKEKASGKSKSSSSSISRGELTDQLEPTPNRSTSSSNGRRRALDPTTRAETIALMVVLMLSCLIAILPKSILETSILQISFDNPEDYP